MKQKFVLQKSVKQKLVINKDYRTSTIFSHVLTGKKETFFLPENKEKNIKKLSQNLIIHNEKPKEVSRTEQQRQETKEPQPSNQRKSMQKIEEKNHRDSFIRPRAKSQTPSQKYSNISKKNSTIPKKWHTKFSKTFEIIDQILNILTAESIIQMKAFNLLIIHKNKFEDLLLNLLQSVSKNQISQQEQKDSSLPFLREPLQRFCTEIKLKNLKVKSSKLVLESNVCRRKITNQDYHFQKDNISNNILSLIQQQVCLQEKIRICQRECAKITEVYRQKQQQTSLFMKKSAELQAIIQKQQAKYSSLMQSIHQRESLLQNINSKADQILNYVQYQQQKKILHYVSQAYKDIQSQIYDYALYLQTNAMASSLVWQPKPFRAVQKWVYQEMQRVNKFVMSPDESNQDKSTRMKFFITNTTRKFRTKDQEMIKITDFKTECIKKFVQMMQKWLQNWELKQEYLVGLRKEFAVESQQLNNLLIMLDQKQKAENAQNIEKEDPFVVQKIKSLWHKIQLNYKYGNSFY